MRGLELYRICRELAIHLSPAEIARPFLESLASQCGEAIILIAYERRRRQMIRIDKIEALHPLRYQIDLNRWVPIHAGASGMAILSFLPAEERQLIYKEDLRRFTELTRVEPEDLEAAVKLAHEQGYLCTKGERTPGAVGIAAPLFDAERQVFGDVCVTIPQQRFEDHMEAELSRGLLETCTAISNAFMQAGYRGM
jgi:IclR family acetate operon transcriptional repressor